MLRPVKKKMFILVNMAQVAPPRFLTRDSLQGSKFEELYEKQNVSLFACYQYVFAMTDQAVVSIGKSIYKAPPIDDNLTERLTCFGMSEDMKGCTQNVKNAFHDDDESKVNCKPNKSKTRLELIQNAYLEDPIEREDEPNTFKRFKDDSYVPPIDITYDDKTKKLLVFYSKTSEPSVFDEFMVTDKGKVTMHSSGDVKETGKTDIRELSWEKGGKKYRLVGLSKLGQGELFKVKGINCDNSVFQNGIIDYNDDDVDTVWKSVVRSKLLDLVGSSKKKISDKVDDVLVSVYNLLARMDQSEEKEKYICELESDFTEFSPGKTFTIPREHGTEFDMMQVINGSDRISTMSLLILFKAKAATTPFSNDQPFIFTFRPFNPEPALHKLGKWQVSGVKMIYNLLKDGNRIACDHSTYSGKSLKEFFKLSSSKLLSDLKKIHRAELESAEYDDAWYTQMASLVTNKINEACREEKKIEIRSGALLMADSLLSAHTIAILLRDPSTVIFTGFSMGGFCATGYAFIFSVLVMPILKAVSPLREFRYFLAGSVRVGNVGFNEFLSSQYPESCHLTAMVGVHTMLDENTSIGAFEPDPVSLIPREDKSIQDTKFVSTYPNVVLIENLKESLVNIPTRNKSPKPRNLILKDNTVLQHPISSARCAGLQLDYTTITYFASLGAVASTMFAYIFANLFSIPVGIFAFGSSHSTTFAFRETIDKLISHIRGLDIVALSHARSGQMWWVHNGAIYLNLLAGLHATHELDEKDLEVTEVVWAEKDHYKELRRVAHKESISGFGHREPRVYVPVEDQTDGKRSGSTRAKEKQAAGEKRKAVR